MFIELPVDSYNETKGVHQTLVEAASKSASGQFDNLAELKKATDKRRKEAAEEYARKQYDLALKKQQQEAKE